MAKAKESLDITVKRAIEFKSGDIAVDFEVNGVMIYGAVLKEGRNGKFISFPSRKGNDGKYYTYVWLALDDDDIKSIEKQANKLI